MKLVLNGILNYYTAINASYNNTVTLHSCAKPAPVDSDTEQSSQIVLNMASLIVTVQDKGH